MKLFNIIFLFYSGVFLSMNDMVYEVEKKRLENKRENINILLEQVSLKRNKQKIQEAEKLLKKEKQQIIQEQKNTNKQLQLLKQQAKQLELLKQLNKEELLVQKKSAVSTLFQTSSDRQKELSVQKKSVVQKQSVPASLQTNPETLQTLKYDLKNPAKPAVRKQKEPLKLDHLISESMNNPLMDTVIRVMKKQRKEFLEKTLKEKKKEESKNNDSFKNCNSQESIDESKNQTQTKEIKKSMFDNKKYSTSKPKIQQRQVPQFLPNESKIQKEITSSQSFISCDVSLLKEIDLLNNH